MTQVKCAECGGSGRIVTNPGWPTGNGKPYQEACSECSGTGTVEDDFVVRLPAPIDPGLEAEKAKLHRAALVEAREFIYNAQYRTMGSRRRAVDVVAKIDAALAGPGIVSHPLRTVDR